MKKTRRKHLFLLWYLIMGCVVLHVRLTFAQSARADLAHALLNQADSLCETNHYGPARKNYQLAEALFTFTEHCHLMIRAQAGTARIDGLQGRPEAAVQTLTQLSEQAACCPEHEVTLKAGLQQDLSLLYAHQRAYDRALPLQKEALEGFERTHGPFSPITAEGQAHLGHLHKEMEQHEKAHNSYEKARDIYTNLKGIPEVKAGKIHYFQGENYLKWGKFKEAKKAFQQALNTFHKYLPANHPFTIDGLNGLAASHSRMSKYDLAREIYQKNLVMTRQTYGNEHVKVVKNLYHLSLTFFEDSHHAEALACLNQALDMFECLEVKPTLLGAHLHRSMGHFLMSLRKPDSSLAHQLTALTLLRTVKNPPLSDLALSYTDLGYAFSNLGQYEQALVHYDQALKLLRSRYDGSNLHFARLYFNTGGIYWMTTQYDLAKTHFQQALDIRMKHLGPDHPKVAACYRYLADLSLKEAKRAEALGYYTRSLAIYLSHYGKWHRQTGKAYRDLGTYYGTIGEYEKAMAYFQKAHRVEERIFGKNHPALAISYNNMATLYKLKGDHQEALASDQKSLALFKRTYGEQHPEVVYVHNELADIYFELGDHHRSLLAYDRAISANFPEPCMPDRPDQEDYLEGPLLLQSLQGKARVTAILKDPTANVINIYHQCDRLIGRLRQSADLENDQIQLGEIAFEVYEAAVAYCLEHHQPGDSLLPLAHYFSERSKAMVLYQSLKEQTAQRHAEVPEALLANERHLKKEQVRLQQQLTLATDETEKKGLNHQLHQTITDYQQLMAHLEENYPEYYQLKHQPPPTSLPFLQKTLSKDQALIEYFWGDTTLYVFTLTREHLWASTTPLPAAFDSLLYRFQTLLATPPPMYDANTRAYTQPASRLYELLLAGPLSYLPDSIKSLVLVPDGPLGHLNFGALIKPLGDEHTYTSFSQLPYVIKDYQLHYVASANLWMESLHQRKDFSLDRPLLSFGGFAPAYDSLSLLTAANPPLLNELVRSGELPLPGAKKEVKEIAKIIGGETWTNAQASKELFLQKASQYAIVHLAMHALLDAQEPLNSCLVFSTPTTVSQPVSQPQRTTREATDADSRKAQDLLYASDIYGMQLSNRMVVLSACNTGRGKIKKGEGVLSLSRAFMYAGCPSLTVSLWNLPDIASSDLMIAYYQNLLLGQSIDAALRNAQLHYLAKIDHPSFSHPYYWGAFITIGDSSPIDFPTREVNLFVMAGIGFILLTGAGIMFMKSRKWLGPAEKHLPG